jgi:hypothetical protein
MRMATRRPLCCAARLHNVPRNRRGKVSCLELHVQHGPLRRDVCCAAMHLRHFLALSPRRPEVEWSKCRIHRSSHQPLTLAARRLSKVCMHADVEGRGSQWGQRRRVPQRHVCDIQLLFVHCSDHLHTSGATVTGAQGLQLSKRLLTVHGSKGVCSRR